MLIWSNYLIGLHKIFDPRSRTGAIPVAVLLSSLLSGCISSPSPILSDANAILGEQGEIHFFSAPGSGPREHSVMAFQWSGSRYVFSGRAGSVSDFTAHPFEGRDLIVQSTSARAPRLTEYAIA